MVAGRCPDEMLTSYLSSQPSNQSRGKALFRYCNIRTYFNDELFMVLPNGDKVYFVETRTNYTVLFDGDSAPLDVVRYPRSPDRAQIASHRPIGLLLGPPGLPLLEMYFPRLCKVLFLPRMGNCVRRNTW